MKNNSNSKITIYDIAKELGLSAGTVGHALNGTGRISADTQKRVVQAAARMGYRPSMIAKSLSKNRTYTLGVVAPVIGNTAYSAMVNGIESVAYNAGYNIILCCSEFDQHRETQYLEMLRERRVEGIVIIPSRRVVSYKDQIDHLLKIEDSGLPVVVLEQNILQDNLTKIVMDNHSGAKKIVNHLIELGHKRIGFLHLGAEETDFAGNERFAGYKEALSDAGLCFSEELIAQASSISDYECDTYDKAQFEAYYEAAGRPSAVFAVCDMLAIKIIRSCNMIGLRVPDDIAVVGFDNIAVSGLVTPPLTTIHQPAVEMGKRAADLALGRIDGRLECPVSEKIQGKLVIRQSCGASLEVRS
ncbi:MAG: LacI family DNA-binding transcriptional regulator [Armatimonadota bacterium]|nr:LacI family transcriptional regulator [bacterium]